MHDPSESMQIIAPESAPQNAQINAVVILTQHRQSQKFLLLSSFIGKTVAYNYVYAKRPCKSFFLKHMQIDAKFFLGNLLYYMLQRNFYFFLPLVGSHLSDQTFLPKISKIWSSAASSTLFFAL